jgi:hypothetical protein
MTMVFGSSHGRRPSGGRLRRLPLLVGLAMLAGCAGPTRIEVPAELPLRTNDGLFAIQWALQQEPSTVRAVGRVSPSVDAEARLTLGFFGLDARGGIVSRGTAYLQSPFSRGPIPFAVALTPTGRETKFEVRVLDYSIAAFRTN